MINRNYLEKIIKRLKFKPTVDLFAARLNTQLPHFMSLRPDSESRAVNNFTFSWENLSFYAFPSFIYIPRFYKRSGLIKKRVYW